MLSNLNMKTLTFLSILFICGSTLAAPIQIKSLLNFADKYSYQDNRRTIAADQMYSAYKGLWNEGQPYFILEAYNGSSKFKQVALSCNRCRINDLSEEQINLCNNEFKNLYRALFSKELSNDILAALKKAPPAGKSQIITTDNAPEKIRISSGGLKCDTLGGVSFRIDTFPK